MLSCFPHFYDVIAQNHGWGHIKGVNTGLSACTSWASGLGKSDDHGYILVSLLYNLVCATRSCFPHFYHVPPHFWHFSPCMLPHTLLQRLITVWYEGLGWCMCVVTVHVTFVACNYEIDMFPPHGIKYIFYVYGGNMLNSCSLTKYDKVSMWN